MEYAVEIGLGAMICIPSFTKTSSYIQKLRWEGFTDTKRGDPINLILFSQNKKSRLKIYVKL
jgi:hypothetical protein